MSILGSGENTFTIDGDPHISISTATFGFRVATGQDGVPHDPYSPRCIISAAGGFAAGRY